MEPRSPLVNAQHPAPPAACAPAFARPTFGEMYHDGFAFVWRNLRRLGVDEASVRDAAQDVFLVVHRRIDSYDGTSTVRTWLFAIALRVAQDYRRAARRTDARVVTALAPDRDPLDAVVAHGSGPFEEVATAEANRLLLALLDELDLERRTVFVMTELEQMSAPEIAGALDLNLNTVYGRLRAARQQFNQALARFRARRPTPATAPPRRLP